MSEISTAANIAFAADIATSIDVTADPLRHTVGLRDAIKLK